jgi:L-asparaginase
MVKKIVFLGMGGTIAGASAQPGDNVGYRAGEIPVQDLLAGITGFTAALAGHALQCEQLAQLDSKDINFSDWVLLLQALERHLADASVKGVVLTHGTDMLEETAYFLSRVLPAELLQTKPVVLTCAMRPANAINPDGPQNLLDAIALVRADFFGLSVVCAGVVHDPVTLTKVHPYRLDAFSSGEVGCLGFVEEGRVRRLRSSSSDPKSALALDWDYWSSVPWPRVEILFSYANAQGDLVRALCKPVSKPIHAIRGLVMAGTGNGTLHTGLHEALQEAQAAGIRIVRVSRCPLGIVVTPQEEAATVWESMPLSPVKARIELALQLMAEG